MATATIKAAPHAGQARVHACPARFRVLAAGRRWGKTRLGVMECLDVASCGGRAWWVAPTYKVGAVGWRPLARIGAQIPGADVRLGDREIRLPGAGTVQVRSAEDPDSLRGEGLDFVVLDECAFMSERAWNEGLRPGLSDRHGRALFISTPKGRNWFWRLSQRGADPHHEDWAAFSFPSSANPYITAEEIDAARADLPERVFLQEYEAMFLDDGGGVFRRVAEAARAERQPEAIGGHEYVIGVDWGRTNDATVFVVLDTTEKVVADCDRMTQTDYALQVGRLRALLERFPRALVIAESNSMGGPLVEHLRRSGLPVRPFETTNARKAEAVDALALAFERGEIQILDDPVLIAELQAYESERLPSGRLRYSAPEGVHDDCVMALLIAWDGIGTCEKAAGYAGKRPAIEAEVW